MMAAISSDRVRERAAPAFILAQTGSEALEALGERCGQNQDQAHVPASTASCCWAMGRSGPVGFALGVFGLGSTTSKLLRYATSPP
jgi:hypothetical protein